THSALDFAEHTLLDFDWRSLTAIRRKAGADELEIDKKDDGWQIVKPDALRADQVGMDDLAERLAGLRAARIASLDATDLKPFGLDAPAATISLVLKDKVGKTSEKTIQVGQPTAKDTEERFARVGGSNAVAVLSAEMAKRLVAEPLKFRDRTIVRFA